MTLLLNNEVQENHGLVVHGNPGPDLVPGFTNNLLMQIPDVTFD